jgi:hypothetical protein
MAITAGLSFTAPQSWWPPVGAGIARRAGIATIGKLSVEPAPLGPVFILLHALTSTARSHHNPSASNSTHSLRPEREGASLEIRSLFRDRTPIEPLASLPTRLPRWQSCLPAPELGTLPTARDRAAAGTRRRDRGVGRHRRPRGAETTYVHAIGRASLAHGKTWPYPIQSRRPLTASGHRCRTAPVSLLARNFARSDTKVLQDT